MHRGLFHKAVLFTLALLLALTGQSMAAARGAPDPSGQMVICSGSGPVAPDAGHDSQPAEPPPYCPDCALHVLDGVAPPDLLCDRAETFVRHRTGFAALLWAERFRTAATARGPPVFV